MSYRVKKLTIGKGRTVSHEQNGEWVKEYYEVELDIPDESELSIARENALALLNEWLNIAEKHEPEKPKFQWNPERIKWQKAEGWKGEFEKSEDVNNPEFKSMLKDLASHGDKLTREGWFYWVYKNGSTVGRKRREVKRG